MSIRFLVVAAAVALLGTAVSADAGKRRRIEVRYDITKLPHEALEVWIDCVHPQTGSAFERLSTCDGATTTAPTATANAPKRERSKQLTGPDASRFVFGDKDDVVFVMLYKADAASKRRADIVAAITGTGVSDKDLEAFKKLVGATTADTNVVLTGSGREADTAEFVPLLDNFEIGQKITVTFTLKETVPEEGKPVEKAVDTRGPFAFRVGGAPRFKLSYGLGFTNAPEPSIAIEKTSTVVTFEKDGKTQEAFQQAVVLRDKDTEAALIQSLVTFAHVRVWSDFYGSVGIQASQKLFEEPMAGISYRKAVGNKLAVYVTGGVLFSRETAIRADSGFFDGYRIDPTQALTVDDIPKETRKPRRAFVGLTFEFR